MFGSFADKEKKVEKFINKSKQLFSTSEAEGKHNLDLKMFSIICKKYFHVELFKKLKTQIRKKNISRRMHEHPMDKILKNVYH